MDMGSMAIDPASSDSSSSPPDSADVEVHQSPVSKTKHQQQKRTANDAGLKLRGARPTKSVKRRASKACQCCRARKVRCNVVEHGAPCTNCRLDEVECIVSESKRKKKWSNSSDTSPSFSKSQSLRSSSVFPMSAAPPYEPLRRTSEHVPHAVYQDLGRDMSLPTTNPRSPLYASQVMLDMQKVGRRSASFIDSSLIHPSLRTPTSPQSTLPPFIKPMPAKFGSDELSFLEKKGAITIPSSELRDELLRNYVEYVHPYMPLLNFHELVATIDRNNGFQPVSLLLFQAIMFSAVAFVDMRYLRAAGYTTRREARREFFQKARLLYDFDVEVDRISLIQALLLMTYWYETPNDQKDSHHWMGIAVSLSHTIGLHRSPENSASIEQPKQRLWRRIWWSIYMRDRLIALGMRRPTRIKDNDFDVPMLTINDFEIVALPAGLSCISNDCHVMRNTEKQEQLAIMCIEKAKLCVAMSHILRVQYSVLNNNRGVVHEEGNARTTMMLVAKKIEPDTDEVQACDERLRSWAEELAPEAQYVAPTWSDIEHNNESVALNRSLLHMMYYATLSALHRPQVLPSATAPSRMPSADVVENSRRSVRQAATEITKIANTLQKLALVPYLPTTGVTVLLPAIIIHLLDIKAPDEITRRTSLKGFCECMQIMAKLRDIYAAADYSTAFLEAAIRKAEITLPQKPNEVRDSRNIITSSQGLVDAGRRMHLVDSAPESGALTPPPDDQGQSSASGGEQQLSDADIARRLHNYLASTPPESDDLHNDIADAKAPADSFHLDLEPDFESMFDLEAAGDVWSLQDTAFAAGESSGFTMDMEWMKRMTDDALNLAIAEEE